VRSADDLVRIVSEQLEPGQQSTFEVVRGGNRKAVAVKLGERPREQVVDACS
jgi:S1-C subfamily serine protease